MKYGWAFKLWSLVLMWLLCAQAIAQSAEDNLSPDLASSALAAQIEAAFATRNTDPVSAQRQLTDLKAQAERASNYSGIALASHYLAVLGYNLAEYAATEAMLDAVLIAYRQRFMPQERGELELWQGRMWYRLEDMERAEARFRALEEEFEGESLLADVYMSQSVMAYVQGIFDQAVSKGLNALRLFEAEGNVAGQIEAHKNLGIDYLRIDDLDSSLFHFKQGEALLGQNEDVFNALVLAANMGITLQAMGDLEGAMAAYEWTYESAVTLKRPLTQAQSLLNIATIYSNDYKDYAQAIEYYERSLAIAQQHDLQYGVMLNHMNIGVALGGLGRSDEALASFDRAYEMAEAMNRPNEIRHLLGQMAEVYAEAGRHQEAYEAVLAEQEIAEELFNENRDRAIADLRVQYETELKEQALALAEAKTREQSQWIRFLWSLIALVVVLASVGGGFLVFRHRALKELYERNIELVDAFYGGQTRRSDAAETEQDPMRALFDRLLALIEAEGLFKDEQLSLATLARQAQSNEKYVSQAISRYANMNFSNFINYYRINEAKKLLRTADEKVGITDVMLDCGFSHKSTFYAAFKKFTGMTPTQFRAVAYKESLKSPQTSANMGVALQ